ncbi:hypothetical protein Mlab_0514 [Methanocorpusculum labreanum Z]|uniref:Uncharacterized protein n=1 Tax=Methanocorpusculum labreanum (strain ATCC 43576 / DSM 4855 / Z) TaxID=410358 RepID=A2SQT2_METLZ|nr:hypothetical protein Mlab_0514 [Methanocorpusculum labreanum Z]
MRMVGWIMRRRLNLFVFVYFFGCTLSIGVREYLGGITHHTKCTKKGTGTEGGRKEVEYEVLEGYCWVRKHEKSPQKTCAKIDEFPLAERYFDSILGLRRSVLIKFL